LERTGKFKTVAFCEIDKYCTLLLQKHWKGIKIYEDVRKINKEQFDTDGIEYPDIITGGFPCQPFSVAGKQKGTGDDRHLWPEMFRIIKTFKPKFVIGENVKGLINIQDGVVFETVCTDLESEGYEVQAFNIPAAGVGAPHRRERIWILATLGNSELNGSSTTKITRSIIETSNNNKEGENATREFEGTSKSRNSQDVENSRCTLQQGTVFQGENENEIRKGDANQSQRSSGSSRYDVAYTERERLERLNQQSTTISGKDERTYTRNESSSDQATGTKDVANPSSEQSHSNDNGQEQREISQQEQIELGGRSSGTLWPSNWEFEPNVGRVANGVPGRVHRLKGLGNSIVPKIAEEIGKAIIGAYNGSR
jgi:DNA (cytosine-5)-methyltransferase 1